MILFEIVGSESHPAYQRLKDGNIRRQYAFLESLVNAALDIERPMISATTIKALNYHAIACLHISAGEYRPCPLKVNGYDPPEHYLVPELMNSFVNQVNRYWNDCDVYTLAAYCLWRLNYIHPFVNGNGRTARVRCHFVVCLKLGVWLLGRPILPELIVKERDRYVQLLKMTDVAFAEQRENYLYDLSVFIYELLQKQLLSIAKQP